MSNATNSAIYVGVTSDIKSRYLQHVNKTYATSFTSKYNINKLVYYEVYNDINNAIEREKQLKAGSRKKKVDLITAFNPHWNDLFPTHFDDGLL